MGIYIRIEKTSEKDGVYCYEVSPSGSTCNTFFITIAKGSHKVYFYKDLDCSHLLGYVDFTKDKLIQVNELPSGIAAKAAVKAYMASKKGEFPDSLSVYS